MPTFEDNYFDLYQVFVNEVIGDAWLAIIIGFILITFFCVKSKMAFELATMLCLLFSIIMFEGTGLMIIWVYTVLAIGTIFYYNIAKAVDKV